MRPRLLSQRLLGPQAPGLTGEESAGQTGELHPLLSDTRAPELLFTFLPGQGTRDSPRQLPRQSSCLLSSLFCILSGGPSPRRGCHFVSLKPKASSLKHMGPRARSRAILQGCRIACGSEPRTSSRRVGRREQGRAIARPAFVHALVPDSTSTLTSTLALPYLCKTTFSVAGCSPARRRTK